jgi:hypothetical protein
MGYEPHQDQGREARMPTREPCPPWLVSLRESARPDAVDLEAFFTSRVVMYPGADSDGQPLRVFAHLHAAHCFLYVDQSYRLTRLMDTLDGRYSGYDSRVRGYHTFARISVDPRVIVPDGFDTALPERSTLRFGYRRDGPNQRLPSFVLLEILERDAGLDDSHGPVRLALLCVAADAYDVFEAAFVRRRRAPFAVMLQDHGFGGNHDRFGANGRLDRLASRVSRPRWLLVGSGTQAWDGYEPITSCGHGGIHCKERILYLHQAFGG